MDAKIKSGNKESRRYREAETSEFRKVYFNLPHASQDETLLTFSSAYGHAEGWITYAAHLGIVVPPVGCDATELE